MPTPGKNSNKSLAALNWLNFFAADISDNVGPFLAVYLASNLKWNAGMIAGAISATTFSMVVGQSPAGYIVDRTFRKKIPIIIASLIVGTTALFFPIIICCHVVIGLAASFYIPTLIALTSVVCEKNKFDQTLSKNQSYDEAGNVAAAVLTGVVAKFTKNAGIFYVMMLQR